MPLPGNGLHNCTTRGHIQDQTAKFACSCSAPPLGNCVRSTNLSVSRLREWRGKSRVRRNGGRHRGSLVGLERICAWPKPKILKILDGAMSVCPGGVQFSRSSPSIVIIRASEGAAESPSFDASPAGRPLHSTSDRSGPVSGRSDEEQEEA